MDLPAISLVSDIHVKRKSLEVIRPETRTERYSLFLSNFDQKLVGYVTTFVHFFTGNQEIDFDAIIYVHTEALRKILEFYDFISGRLTFNSEQRRFEIDCNAAGVPLAICTSELSLEEMGDLTYPNPVFTQLCLLPKSTNQISQEDPLTAFQVTRFRCGGFAVGTAVNHGLMDGFALHEFAKNFAHVLRKGDVAFLPVSDRTCLKARVPLQIKFDHEELIKPSQLGSDYSPSMQRNLDLLPNKEAMDKHVFQLFSLSGKTLGLLKLKAKEGGVSHCTSFIAALAHLWRTRTAAMTNINGNDATTVQYFVDIRSRMRPPLPREFVGNAIKTAYAKATARELQEQPFAVIVKKLEEAGNRLTDEYLRSTIDWLELHDGVIRLENGFLATSLTHMEYEDMEIVKGIRSIYAGPVISGTVDLVVFMADPKDKDGIKMLISLEPSNMARFRLLFKDVDSDTATRSNL